MEERKYFVKHSWIFNLEAMHDKLWCIIYDIREGEIELPIRICGDEITDINQIHSMLDEASELEYRAKAGRVTSKEYGRIKKMVNWRVEQRYARCMASGMDERDAGRCFEDL